MNRISIRILTFQKTNNCGAMLQAYALMRFLLNYCDDVAIIDYCPKWVQDNQNSFKNIIHRMSVKEILMYPFLFVTKIKFDSFVKNKCRLTETVYSAKEIKERIKCDCFIVGSDQVWNPEITKGLDEAYLLQFDSDSKKIAYAASCGLDNLSNETIMQLVGSLGKFNAISVREKSLEKILKSNKLSNIVTVLDPTFLLTAKDYRDVAKYFSFANYVLIYAMHDSNELRKVANIVAAKYKLKILDTSKMLKKWPADKVIRCLSPTELLGLIDKASFVVTNSFHGTALSIIFRKHFYSLEAGNRSSRIISLLNEFELMNRFVYLADDCINIEKIEYSKVENLIQEKIQNSKSFLCKSIGIR